MTGRIIYFFHIATSHRKSSMSLDYVVGFGITWSHTALAKNVSVSELVLLRSEGYGAVRYNIPGKLAEAGES